MQSNGGAQAEQDLAEASRAVQGAENGIAELAHESSR